MPTLSRVASASTCAIALLLIAELASPPIAAQTPPQFRGGIDLVTLDVSVLDRNRKPVMGLTVADFELFEDGVPQRIAAFHTVTLPDTDTSGSAWMRTAAFDVQGNQFEGQRIFVILMDDYFHGGPWGWRTAKRVGHAVVDQLGPNDLAAVVYMSDAKKGQEFTTDRGRLLASIDRFEPGVNMVLPIRALHPVVNALSSLEGRRKVIVYVSSGFPYSPLAMAAAVQAGNPGVDLAAGAMATFGELQDLIRAAQRAHVRFYTVDLSGLTVRMPNQAMDSTDSARDAREFLQIISTETGGNPITMTNAPEQQTGRIFQENGSYYLLGYAPVYRSTPGRYHRLEVKVKRPNLEVTSRRGFVTPRDGDKAQPSPPATQALNGLLPNPDIPMIVTAAPFAAGIPSAGPYVALTVGLDVPVRVPVAPDDLNLSLLVTDPDGKTAVSRQQGLHITPRSGGGDVFRIQYVSRVDLKKPGNYSIRVAAHSSATDKSGSVFTDVIVPDFARDAVSLSGVIVDQQPPPTSVPKEPPAGVPATPTVSRRFAPGDAVTIQMRVCQGGKNEIQRVKMTARIVDAHDATVFMVAPMLERGRFDASRGADYAFEIPLSRLTSGAYLLHVEASLDNGKSASRDVRFSIE